MNLVRAILCATALASLSAPALAQSRATAPVSSEHIDRVIVGATAAPGQIGAAPSAGLYEGRSVASGKRHCWVNVYGDRQCEYR